ncbi:MAG: hypothetical protein ABIN94_09495 [Ferruginibacter sp.]
MIGISVLLLIALFFGEIRRFNKSSLWWRLLASTLAVAALACMAIPISINHKLPAQHHRPAVLLTEGYNKDSLQYFLSKNTETNIRYTIDTIPFIDTSISDLHIFGEGLSPTQLRLLKDIPLIFHPALNNEGFTVVHCKPQLQAGEKLLLQGTYSNSNNFPVKLCLTAFQITLDSVNIPAKKTYSFNLETVPKQRGKALYNLLVLNGKDTLEKEPVPVEVKPIDTLKLLLLSASPGFEHKFLKNWLSQNGFAVAARTRISKDKYDKSYLNIPTFSFERITPSLLHRFDIIIADAAELALLTRPELSTVQAQVADGMGLLVNADSITAPGTFYSFAFMQYFSGMPAPSRSILSLREPTAPLAPLPGGQNLFIRNRPGEQPLVFDSSFNVLASSKMLGLGKIVFSTINNTYPWMLSGNGSNYSLLWSYLLQKAAKSTTEEHSLVINHILPIVNEPVELNFQTQGDTIAAIRIDSNYLSLQQNPDLPFQSQGINWPHIAGWQTTFNSKGQQFNWYTYKKSDWKNIVAIDKTRQTNRYIHQKKHIEKNAVQVQKYTRKSIPSHLFFGIFIICCCFLWLEKKLSS